MADATAEANKALQVTFERHLKLGFHGARTTSDGGLLAYRELDEALGLTAATARTSATGCPVSCDRRSTVGLPATRAVQ